uniref:Endonuclease/exonuclease/phosphatase domain-containing protein n=1 Tax=Aegilops tauschii TaxID=37682 RepID=R7W6J7_AEGTA
MAGLGPGFFRRAWLGPARSPARPEPFSPVMRRFEFPVNVGVLQSNVEVHDPKNEIKFMTYNVWSREDIVLYRRMQAISRLIYHHSPDVIFFQEITPYILRIFQSFSWWKEYHSSPISQEQQKEKNFCMMLSKVPLENYACWKFATTATGKSYLEPRVDDDEANPHSHDAARVPLPAGTDALHGALHAGGARRRGAEQCGERRVRRRHVLG